MKLYIIGNGFDLHHGLETGYTDFHRYLKVHNHDLEAELDNYFTFQRNNNTEYLWRCFEEDLAKFDFQLFFDNHNHIDVNSDDFRPSFCYGLEDDLKEQTERLVDEIRAAFEDWISKIDCTTVHEERKDKLLPIDNQARFINFNYTDTLEETYNVDRSSICYIHNNATEQYGDLIFGHGQEDLDIPIPDERDENGDSNRTMFTDSDYASRAAFYALRKDVQSVISEHQDFFTKLSAIDEIIVLGHSFGHVDLPYFKEISRHASAANWTISWYDKSEDIPAIQHGMQICGIPQERFRLIRMEDLQR